MCDVGGEVAMKRQVLSLTLAAVGALGALIAVGCHADPDDAAGQARELADSVRRQNAIANIQRLYGAALANASGDRAGAEPRAIADATVGPLTQCYLDNPGDRSNGLRILDVLVEMRDTRSLPALTKALEWQNEISEEHAVRAARVIRELTLDEAQRGQVVPALATALGRVTRERPVDNQMRIEFLNTLGRLADRRATEAMVRVLLLQDERQNFLINRLAAEQLGHLEDPEAVPALIQALFLFAANNPGMRMNDVAAQALVRIGRPALEPLLATLRGENAEVNAVAAQYIAAVRARQPDAAAQMSVQSIVSNEAGYALGQLGFREAIDPLIAETNQIDPGERPDSREEDPTDTARMMGAAIALVSINREEADTPRIRAALLTVFRRSDVALQNQLLVGMQHTMDPGLLDFLHTTAQRPRNPDDEIPDQRILAFRAYAFLANRSEIARLRAILAVEPEGICRDSFTEFEPILAVAEECDQDLACWQNKLGDSNSLVVRKAAYMAARYGRGNPAAITALVARIGHSDEQVRGEVLYALDYAAPGGSPEAVARIEELGAAEAGRSVWEHVEALARAIQARLEARSAHH